MGKIKRALKTYADFLKETDKKADSKCLQILLRAQSYIFLPVCFAVIIFDEKISTFMANKGNARLICFVFVMLLVHYYNITIKYFDRWLKYGDTWKDSTEQDDAHSEKDDEEQS